MAKNSLYSFEIPIGIIALVLIWLFGGISPFISGILAVWIALYFFFSGVQVLQGGNVAQNQPYIPSASSAPVANSPTLAEKMASINIPRNLKCPSCGANIQPTDKKCNYCNSSLVPLIDLPQPATFGAVQVGQVRISPGPQPALILLV